MSLNRLTSRHLLFATGILTVVLAFQNCDGSALKNFSGQSSDADTSPAKFSASENGNGQGYDGKILVSIAASPCGDGSKVKGLIRFQGASGELVRDECVDLATSVTVQESEVTLVASGYLYKNKSFQSVTSISNCQTHPEWNCPKNGIEFYFYTLGRTDSLIYDISTIGMPADTQFLGCGANSCSANNQTLSFQNTGSTDPLRYRMYLSSLPSAFGFSYVGSGGHTFDWRRIYLDGTTVGPLQACAIAVSTSHTQGFTSCPTPATY